MKERTLYSSYQLWVVISGWVQCLQNTGENLIIRKDFYFILLILLLKKLAFPKHVFFLMSRRDQKQNVK